MILFNDNLQKFSSSLNSNFPKMWGYTDLNTTTKTMSELGYFNRFIGVTELKDEDFIYVLGSNGAALFKYIIVNGNTELVNPIIMDVHPFVYRYVLSIRFIADNTIVTPGSIPIFIPRSGTIVGITAMHQFGFSANVVFQMKYLGTNVGVPMGFGLDDLPSGRHGQSVSFPVLNSVDTDPGGLDLFWSDFTQDVDTFAIYTIQIEILITSSN